MPLKILVSAGEASGDLYAGRLVSALRGRLPEACFFGCAGHHMVRAGVRPVVHASSLAVVGLAEVVRHVPRVYTEYRRLIGACRRERPQLAILTDSPDFHLRIARRLKRLGIPVVYLVAPQVWAWRSGRIRHIRRNVDRLLCIFPFEEDFFRRHGVGAHYIGHPLARMVRPALTREEFLQKHGCMTERPLITVLPGSRAGEAERHLPALREAAAILQRETGADFILATPAGLPAQLSAKRAGNGPEFRVVEGETWDAIAHADLALAASGTVTVEAALLGTPMVTFYRVSRASWMMGKWLVDVPFYSMVNLVADRAVVPELMQNDMTGERIAAEARRLLGDSGARERMRRGLGEVAARLSTEGDPMERAAQIVQELLNHGANDVS